ncbi:alpha/beta fold hydrolase [Streptomyces sp. f150]|uniref:alpha/beta fold hydrolase n=1 Tax=Streptomyces sp. f150 TaxID=1827699 RepID=UPI0015CF459B
MGRGTRQLPRGPRPAARSALTLDSRGTEESEKPNTPYGTELFALDVVAVLDHLGVHRADVYGTSMGRRLHPGLAGDRSRSANPRSAPGQQESPGRLARGSFVERVTRIELAL